LSLDDYSRLDPRVVLLRPEHLAPQGLTDEGRRFALGAGWDHDRAEILDRGFRLYWGRADALARRASELPAPRLRHVAVVRHADRVRPFAQMLNQSAWTMYEADFDPERSNAELVAYLLLHGDRLAQTGELTFAAVHLAPYWFERSEAERRAFAEAARRSTRPDAAIHRAVADALPWLRELRHERLRPPRRPAGHRAVPGTGLLVPRALEREPELLVEAARAAATASLAAYYERWRAPSPAARASLTAWLRDEAPPLVVTSGDRIVWDPERPAELDAIEHDLAGAGEEALRDVRADLEVVGERTRRFLASLVAPHALPPPDAATAQSGYVYMHRERRLLAYSLREPAIERLLGPALPYARSMLGARALHEWAHLAAEAGWVPRTASDAAWADATARFAAELDTAVARAPREVRDRTRSGLLALPGSGSAGGRLCELFLARMPDYQSNLVAARYWSEPERETYVRQNVRSLRSELPPERLWSMLVRYLYEMQYLGFSATPEPRRYFLGSTWFDRDFLEPGVIDEARFERLAEAAAALCAAYAVDEARFQAG
jgi:hypothetical protein